MSNAAWWYLHRHLTQDTADAVALIGEEGELTYRGLHARVCRTARVLAEASVGPGDRVVTVLRDSVDAVACILAAMQVGAVPVPVSPMLPVDDQQYVVDDCRPSAVVVETADGELPQRLADNSGVTVWSRGPGAGQVHGLTEAVAQAAALTTVCERDGADAALIQYTSGSTGRPKGVVHLHRGLLAFPQGLVKHLGITRDDRVLSTAKLPFGYGFGNSVLLPFSVGASAVLFAGRSEPHAVADLLRRTRPTLLCAVPTLYASLLSMPQAAERRLDFSSVRLAVSAGEHLGPQLSTRLTDTFGLTMVNGLGSTECLHIFLATVPGVSRPGVTGVPIPGFEAQVCDDEGRVLEAGGIGHLRVSGPSVADRYWDRPDTTAGTFRDGWVYTGDTMTYDVEQGWVYLGRSDNILNVGGMKIVPTEIEDEIMAVPGVHSCAVVGVPDDNDITRIVAHIVPEPGTGEELRGQVLAALRRTLPPFKRPQTVRLVEALPTTATGKTARYLIRRRELEGQA